MTDEINFCCRAEYQRADLCAGNMFHRLAQVYKEKKKKSDTQNTIHISVPAIMSCKYAETGRNEWLTNLRNMVQERIKGEKE